MTISSVTQTRNDRMQFPSLFQNVIEYEAVWDPASVNSNSEQHENVTVVGARLGDFVMVSIDVDVQDLDLSGHVTAADVVTVGLHNLTAGAVNIGSCNLHIIVLQAIHHH